MNTRQPAPTTLAPRPGATARGNSSISVIGAGLSITGDLQSKDEIQIEGKVEGDIHAQRIVIGETASVIGTLVAEEVVVRGSMLGSIRGHAVTFQSTSHVEGDVIHKSLVIEEGAFFDGKSHRSDDPLSVKVTPTAVPPTATQFPKAVS
jgi:cytoskeletal protein CcmA (bactofilin family)